MATNTIDAALVQKMFLAGAKNLESKKEWINDLNVFPVPDGDTGTNMTLTIMSAAKEVSSIANPNMENLSKAISSGSLRGARGNSGVILSQLLRGFTKEMKGVTEITVETLALATSRATETAYKAVMKPKEGTILNADVNGAGNIIRKVYPNAFDGVTDFSYTNKTVIRVTREVLCHAKHKKKHARPQRKRGMNRWLHHRRQEQKLVYFALFKVSSAKDKPKYIEESKQTASKKTA